MLATLQSPKAVHASPVRLARGAIAEVIDAAEALRNTREATPERVHTLRRACRSASVELNLLRGAIDEQAADRLQKILTKLRRRAGSVRDLDVHLEIASELASGHEPPRRLQREIEEERPGHEQRLLAYLDKVAPRKLKRLRARLSPGETPDVGQVRDRVAERAAKWIARANRVLSRPLPAESALHELRIDLKKLRVSLRTLRQLGVRGTKRKEAVIVEATRHLGRFHDVATLRERLESRPDADLPEIATLLRSLRSEEGNAVVRARESLRRLRRV